MSESRVSISPRTLGRILLRFGVAAALLVFVFRLALPDEGEGIVSSLLAAWQTGAASTLAWFTLAFTILGVSFAVGASRFSILLRGADVHVEWLSLFRAYLVAGFFNLVLPGAILGDVYRLWDVKEEAGAGSRALGILVVERLLSLSALGCLGLVAAPFIPLGGRDRGLGFLLMFACATIALGTAAALHPTSNRLLRSLLGPVRHLSDRAANALDGALVAVAQLARRKDVIARGFGLSLVNQGLPVAAVAALAVPLAGDVAWYWFVIIVPFVTLVSLIPVSIGGTGVREYLYVALFGAVGMPRDAALALSLSVLATAIVWAIVGFVIFSIDRRSPSAGIEETGSPLPRT